MRAPDSPFKGLSMIPPVEAAFGWPDWPCLSAVPLDIVTALSQGLGSAWVVEREIDCQGEISIIVLGAGEDDADNSLPTFIFYERDGLMQVATVTNDEWRAQRSFESAQAAVAMVIAKTACLSTG